MIWNFTFFSFSGRNFISISLLFAFLFLIFLVLLFLLLLLLLLFFYLLLSILLLLLFLLLLLIWLFSRLIFFCIFIGDIFNHSFSSFQMQDKNFTRLSFWIMSIFSTTWIASRHEDIFSLHIPLNLRIVTVSTKNILLNKFIKKFEHDIIRVFTFYNACLLHIGSKFRAHVFHDWFTWYSQMCGHIFNIEYISLNSIESWLLLKQHLRHFVSVTGVLYTGWDGDHM